MSPPKCDLLLIFEPVKKINFRRGSILVLPSLILHSKTILTQVCKIFMLCWTMIHLIKGLSGFFPTGSNLRLVNNILDLVLASAKVWQSGQTRSAAHSANSYFETVVLKVIYHHNEWHHAPPVSAHPLHLITQSNHSIDFFNSNHNLPNAWPARAGSQTGSMGVQSN